MARWLVGLHAEDEGPDHTTLHRFRERLGVERVEAILRGLVEQMEDARLLRPAVQLLQGRPI
ncbi:MAG: transposase [Armatimonadetes bacterium]|nr:transposase [Armatimonadota bacterium]